MTLKETLELAIGQGALVYDAAQAEAIDALDTLLADIANRSVPSKKGALGWLFGKSNKVAPEHSVPGLYLWGGVGRGKTMLMDAFFDLAPVAAKRRVHFHAFMQDVHSRIHVWRQSDAASKDKSADPIPPVADQLALEAQLLCFDEFAVTDVADAMILARLFTGLFDRGVTVVATSNVAPDLLYKDGLNRSWFLPFIDLVKSRMSVVHLDSDTDHRMEKLINADVYMTGSDAGLHFEKLWADMTEGLAVEPASIEVSGRTLTFDQACGGIFRATFDEICREALGAGDYLAMADRFHTLFLQDVPVMEHADRNAAKRFIAFIDTWYDRRKLLILQAASQPSGLSLAKHGTEAFEFDRTISRLTEMQGDEWLAMERI